ncbi:MAG: DUF2062 domain-containing protein [Pirellulaceae bacterium]|nr:DUF2062 domain-containing protein [Pirellulaceae bacterium]
MKFVSDKLISYWRRTKHFCVCKILHADDPPHTLALGIAIGIFVGFLPLMGIQMALAVGIAWPFRANKLIAGSLVWISNPLTMVPIYYPGYWLGCKLLNEPLTGGWLEILQSDESSTVKLRNFLENLADFAGPLMLGTFVLASVAGVISYYASLAIIRTYRLRRWGQLIPPAATPRHSSSDDPPDSAKHSPGSETAA